MTRVADYPIHTQFTDRWSPRAFTGESISKETLLSFFEAARWAPSNSCFSKVFIKVNCHWRSGLPR